MGVPTGRFPLLSRTLKFYLRLTKGNEIWFEKLGGGSKNRDFTVI